jgi:nitrate/nitrite transport system ATP-binding protein
MSLLHLSGVAKSFGEGAQKTPVLSNVELRVDEGEFVAIVGFSGTGKTTLISLIAGLLAADEGTLQFDGKPITGAGPDRAVIFQNYSLLPWLTVQENVLLAVRSVFPTWSKQKQRAHAEHYVEMVNLTPAARKRPHELSGGMRQRVSVARALAMTPRLLLLDEPLGALDALTRGQLQKEIQRIISSEGRTAVMITNDVDEAILLADRILPLKPGPHATLGPAFEVALERPRNAAELNSSAEFKRIRNELTQYLLDARDAARARERRASSVVEKITRLPALTPVDLTA